MSFERIKTEYYTVPKSQMLLDLLSSYKKINNTCYSLNERQLILYIVNKAIEDKVELYTGELCLETKQNIKLKKTKAISEHFNIVSAEYSRFGARISQRQYFHRLILGFLTVNQKNE